MKIKQGKHKLSEEGCDLFFTKMSIELLDYLSQLVCARNAKVQKKLQKAESKVYKIEKNVILLNQLRGDFNVISTNDCARIFMQATVYCSNIDNVMLDIQRSIMFVGKECHDVQNVKKINFEDLPFLYDIQALQSYAKDDSLIQSYHLFVDIVDYLQQKANGQQELGRAHETINCIQYTLAALCIEMRRALLKRQADSHVLSIISLFKLYERAVDNLWDLFSAIAYMLT